ncbi:MAG: Transketolase domain-containing protein [Candidatus Gottesmanbacteria bacterium GW2011_GWA1_34_13]|uniref:Transketolase domain-containing protein n=1 Tax=Candidatus Gottesmanbacteria bacterium GW2011_GWA1_34_13 TaxID=1618434 RepID=A0A0G0D9D7_9BACT|nr:MAG: Transketolase domain-containing protein [Candidatus Gottesmanbacteria bacterium GW2011_GWA1_34_13]
MKLNTTQKKLRSRLLEIIYNAHLTHIGSCLNAIDIIEAIYQIKNKEEKFILSNGHAGVALYTVLEKHGYPITINPTRISAHPDRNPLFGIDVSTGSLGQGLPIAVGIALSNRQKNVYCLISDGECAEGSIWESLRIIKENNILNLKLFISINGWGGYDPISSLSLLKRVKGFGFKVIQVDGHNISSIKKKISTKPADNPILYFVSTKSDQFPFLKGQDAHYYLMKEKDYQFAQQILK